VAKQYLFRGKPRNVVKPLGRPKKLSEANTEHVLVSPETKERLEALKHNHKEPLGGVVLRLINGYFTNAVSYGVPEDHTWNQLLFRRQPNSV
jgi:hypothetical protein